MIFFLNANGDLLKSCPETVYQGSSEADKVYIVAPLNAKVLASVAFELPNGDFSAPYILTNCEILPVDGETFPDGVSVWYTSLTGVVTQYFGTVKMQVTFYTSGETQKPLLTSQLITINIGKGVIPVPPTKQTDDAWQQILATVSLVYQNVSTVTDIQDIGEDKSVTYDNTDGITLEKTEKWTYKDGTTSEITTEREIPIVAGNGINIDIPENSKKVEIAIDKAVIDNGLLSSIDNIDDENVESVEYNKTTGATIKKNAKIITQDEEYSIERTDIIPIVSDSENFNIDTSEDGETIQMRVDIPLKRGAGSFSVVQEVGEYQKENTANGYSSITLGEDNTSNGRGAVVTGAHNTNDGGYSLMTGSRNENNGAYNCITGYNNTINGAYCIAAANSSLVRYYYTILAGYGLIGTNSQQIVLGLYNEDNPNFYFAIGDGLNNDNRSTVFAIDRKGNIKTNGNITVGKTASVGSVKFSGEKPYYASFLVVTDDGETDYLEVDEVLYKDNVKTIFGNQSIIGKGNIDLYEHDIVITGTNIAAYLTCYSSKNTKIDSLTDLKTICGNTFTKSCTGAVSGVAVMAITESKLLKVDGTEQLLTGVTFTDTVTTI